MTDKSEPHRVTDFRIDTVEIPEGKYWDLPDEVRNLINAYSTYLPTRGPGCLRFEIPVYRWEEVNAAMQRSRS